MKLLFASSEAFPLIKTGGLGDVANALPNALAALGVDARMVLPAYRDVLRVVDSFRVLGWLNLSSYGEIRILEASHADFDMPLWLIDAAGLFDRGGNPYTHPDGHDWADNPLRFAVFCQAAALLSIDALQLGWRADVVHANDWQTGLLPAFLSQESQPPRRIFTIHNIAYDCQFDYGTFQQLRLPPHWWSMEHAEFYDRFSMLKAGLVFCDAINTVSPRYAQEISTPEYGYGYSNILASNQDKLSGIINGIDDDTWNPATDPLLAAHYQPGGDIHTAKRKNRQALLTALGADDASSSLDVPLIGFVGRLVFQKGVDLLLQAIEQLLPQHQAQFVLIGSGEADLEHRLQQLAKSHPQQVFSYIGYSEHYAHLLEAGCDIFAMPSRYEPCGLNQLYSLRYGTPPVARNTGGLADSVINADSTTLKNGTATGILFDNSDVESLLDGLTRAIELFADRESWTQLMHTGMAQDVSWQKSAEDYLSLYRQ